MIKQDIVRKVSESLGITLDEAYAIVEVTLSALGEGIANGEDIFIRGLGTFKIITRKPKKARNISKGTFVEVPEHKAVKFIPCKELKHTLAYGAKEMTESLN